MYAGLLDLQCLKPISPDRLRSIRVCLKLSLSLVSVPCSQVSLKVVDLRGCSVQLHRRKRGRERRENGERGRQHRPDLPAYQTLRLTRAPLRLTSCPTCLGLISPALAYTTFTVDVPLAQGLCAQHKGRPGGPSGPCALGPRNEGEGEEGALPEGIGPAQ